MSTIAARITRRRALAMTIDVIIILSAYFVLLAFRFAGKIPADLGPTSRNFLVFSVCAVALHVATNSLRDVYSIVTRYVGLPQAMHLAEAGVLATGALGALAALWPGEGHLLPLSVVAVGGLAATTSMIGVRFYARVFYERSLTSVRPERRVLIVGAGQAADLVIRDIRANAQRRIGIVGLVDDKSALRGMRLHNHPVLGTIADVPALVPAHDVSEILIAIPSANAAQLARISAICQEAQVPIKILPSISDLVDGTVSLADARDLDIRDVLGRPEVETDLGAIATYLRGRRVLVTGAAGSIGSELSRQIARFDPASLVLVDRDESALYHLHETLRMSGHCDYTLAPTTILQQTKMEKLFAEHRPEVVFHAAAFKHVPLMELSPDEAVLNNVKGTLIVAEAAARSGAKRFVNISTDKAVDPVNVMGATKRVGERLIRSLAHRYPQTQFRSVRFGNVLGSQGSVIPIFQRQILEGGPITITHPEMTRYFMLIEEAVQLVLQAAALMDESPRDTGDDYGVFVLEMGAPVRIVDLAHQMIRLMQHRGSGTGDFDDSGIGVEFTGLRPGEKLSEELFCRNETPVPTAHPMVRMARSPRGDIPSDFLELAAALVQLGESHADPGEIIAALQVCVPSYQPFDWDTVGAFPGVTAPSETATVTQLADRAATTRHTAALTAVAAAGRARTA